MLLTRKRFFCLLLPLLAFAFVTDWQKLQIDLRASIYFPAQPTQDKETLWSLDADSAKYLLKIDDLSKRGLDSARAAKVLETPGILDGFSKGFLSGEGSVLISKKASTWRGYTMFEYEVDPGKRSQFKLLYAKLIFVGTKVYSPAVFVKDKNQSLNDRQKFFNSFDLK